MLLNHERIVLRRQFAGSSIGRELAGVGLVRGEARRLRREERVERIHSRELLIIIIRSAVCRAERVVFAFLLVV